SSRRRHTRFSRDWSSDVCSSDLSALATSVVPVIRRVTFEAFFSRLWRLPAFSRRILPEPVTRNRFLAPECVLFFGMELLLSTCVLGESDVEAQRSTSASRLSVQRRSFF